MFFCGRLFLILFWRCLLISKELLINEEIRAKEVRVISGEGEQLGIMSLSSALDAANERNLDLVEISPNANPPVCKIMDYGKYKFDLAKKEKEARKKQKVISVKEIRFSPSIDTNDLNTKTNQASKFLKSGDKVKVSVRFRGRELSYMDNGITLLNQFASKLEDVSVVEKAPLKEGRSMVMFLAPKN
ncbi:MAG: translation initiation factor IF-3 [Clostridia bacterium]|nr:translation initiation factor IF-3 [Clostridia bacterium]